MPLDPSATWHSENGKVIKETSLKVRVHVQEKIVDEARVKAAFKEQREKLLKWAGGKQQRGRVCRGVYPTLGADRGGSGGRFRAEASHIRSTGEVNGGGGSTTFMSKDDLARMRHEMREQCRQRQRDQARRRADMDAECPLFLSLRMRRMMDVALAQPPTQLDVVCHNLLEDGASLQDDAAQAIAALLCHNKFPPAYVQYFLQDMPHLKAAIESRQPITARQLYGDLIDRMRAELREDPPSGVDWTCLPDGALHPLVPAKVSFEARSISAGDRYGVSRINNEEVVIQKRSDDRGPPRTWFGTDEVEADKDDYVPKRAIHANLPIAKLQDEICEIIRDHQVVLIQGETGCGKTTQVPQYILEMACRLKEENRRAVRIVVTQPRRIAAITVAKRVAAELGEEVGQGVVGYKIRGTTVASPRCKLLFCTTGVVLRRLANEGSKWMFSPKTVTHLLVDEVHERGVETDFMLTFLKEVQSRRPNLRVILMSATMDTECFLKYFQTEQKVVRNGVEEVEIVRPPMVVCKAFCHPVEMVYLEDINKRLGRDRPAEAKSPDELRRDPNDVSESDGIDFDLILQIIEECERSPDGAWTFATGPMQSRPRDPHQGAFLIFMPGLGEITEMMTKLEEQPTYSSSWWVLALHANLPPEEQQTCFETMLPYGKTRKIIVSTNVAETSVTVPDVTVVIDPCRERRNQIDRYSNTPMLREQWCALDSLKQRRGRAGRVQPGVCFRMLPKSYEGRLDKVTPPEMQRVPLENVYLQVCASGIDDRKAFLAKTPDPPDDTAVLFAEVALQDLGALDEGEHDGLTPLGRHLAALPCHPRLGKILVLGCLLGMEGPVLSIAAAMSVRNPMLTTQDQNKRQAWQAARLELTEQIGTRSDHCVWAYIMQEWRFGDMKQRDFCRKYGLGFERMCSSMFERKHLCESLVQVGLLPQRFLWNEWYDQDKMPDWNLVRAAVVGGLYPNIIHVERSVPRYQSNSPAEKAKYMRYSVLQRHHTRQDNMSYPKSLNLHPNSLCFGVDQFHCPWLAFYTIQHTTKLYAYDVSEVNPFALLLFGNEPYFNDHTKQLEIGSWARFSCKTGDKILPLIKAARVAVQRVLEKKLEDVSFDLRSSRELAVCIELLKTNGLGYRSPSPPPLEREKRWQKDDDEFNEWQNETEYMLRKDKENEDRMKAAWNAAATAAKR
mmetsp:Transcript_22263/g.40442  ORF Transcript_22263/g.40442 Transcript_22263/m.40442 type:complete len:1182 (+) Transcript_22263:158-3703(+)